MCGITGIFNINGMNIEAPALRRMNAALSHRGPDDEGYFTDRDIGLGHKRLSIIDLSSAARQPISNENGTMWLVYNGEIYNYPELVHDLKNLGHKFKSHSDAEVVLHAYEEWGASALDKFRGMWAFALWDSDKRELFCCRDRFGIKPFYYYLDKDKFVFASEIKAILEHGTIEKSPNLETVHRYLVRGYGYTDTSDETFFSNIRQLKPGCYLSVSRSGASECSYWRLSPHKYSEPADFGKIKEKFLSLLEESTRLSLRSDVPVGIALSGGIDSSSIAVIMSASTKCRIESFSACFDEEGCDERAFINEILKDEKFIPNFVYPQAFSFADELEKIVWHQDEPYSSPSIFSHWEVMKKAKEKGIKVLITGQGGDELLGGYNKFYPYYFLDLLTNAGAGPFLKGLSGLDPITGYTKRSIIAAMIKIFSSSVVPDGLKRIARSVCASKRPAFLRKDFFETGFDKTKDRTGGVRYGSFLNQELYDSTIVSPLPSLLHIDDRNSMAHSVESRPPFLDHKLAEFVFSLSYDVKISGGVTKYLLRESLSGSLPEKIRTRRDKMGFVTPVGIWFKGKLKDRVMSMPDSSVIEKWKIFDKNGMRKVIDEHMSGKADRSFTIWSWVNLEIWLNTFFA
ncbi:MAG: asparagine synthase (glutamine-hydrolyzing) [Candidatus Omnitrophica bacterium]|nr:asparagine synthase (glutamine-hydrolyzing) [Candidatus Omnitrophota bacterium]